MFASGNRAEFVKWAINNRGYRTGIEVGVRDGDFSRFILRNTEINLIGLDSQTTASAENLMEEFPDRFCLVIAKSPDAAARFADSHFDFIHIDADHAYAAVLADLHAWWPKLADGGCFSGDDYAFVDNPTEGRYGVVEAVNQFADELGLALGVAGCGPTREEQLAYAKWNGEQASAYLRNDRWEIFDNPCWYIFKGGRK